MRVLFAPGGLRFETGWLPPPEEGERRVEEVAFVVGLDKEARHDVEVDGEEVFEALSDSGGILELRFEPGRKAAVKIRQAP